MQSRIILISNDSDFFDYIFPKLVLRKSDEVFRFNFNELPEKLHLLLTSVIIINSENSQQQTLELLSLVKNTPVMIFAFNNDENFRLKILNQGALSFVTPLTIDEEFKSLLISSLKISDILDKNNKYKELLVKKKVLSVPNEVLTNYNEVLDCELENIKENSRSAVLAAISPDEKSKFLIQPIQIETIILNNIRRKDILMNYAVNKYFLLFYDTDIEHAQKIWGKISQQIPQKIYAGFAKVLSKGRQQLVNEVLNKLHEAINYEKYNFGCDTEQSTLPTKNFKQFKQEFNKKIEKVINPVLYLIKQKYDSKLYGVILEQEQSDGCSIFRIKGRNTFADFKITSPGFSKINIDITYNNSQGNIDSKRISLEPDELEAGLLEDLLEQFILEFRQEIGDVKT